MVVLQKNSGNLRICIKTEPDLQRHHLPAVERCLAKLAEAHVFLKPSWLLLVAHCLPFGITSAPDIFQRQISAMDGRCGVWRPHLWEGLSWTSWSPWLIISPNLAEKTKITSTYGQSNPMGNAKTRSLWMKLWRQHLWNHWRRRSMHILPCWYRLQLGYNPLKLHMDQKLLTLLIAWFIILTS